MLFKNCWQHQDVCGTKKYIELPLQAIYWPISYKIRSLVVRRRLRYECTQLCVAMATGRRKLNRAVGGGGAYISYFSSLPLYMIMMMSGSLVLGNNKTR